jgi:hypothetical protein
MIRSLIPDNFRKVVSDDRKREVYLSPQRPQGERLYVYAFTRGAKRIKHYRGFSTPLNRARFVTTFLSGRNP